MVTQEQLLEIIKAGYFSIFDSAAVRQVERTAASVITRSLLGALGLGEEEKGCGDFM